MDQRIVFSTAANGQQTARVGSVTLFSTHDPGREAARFTAEALRSRRPSLILVLGAGLGYLEAAAAAQAPNVPVYSVCYASPLADKTAAPGSVWTPDSPRTLAGFLEEMIGERETNAVALIEWPASARAFPETARRARDEVLRILRENSFGGLTVASSGRRWLKNCLVNFLCLEPSVGNPLRPGLPLVIAASGPSLSRSLPLLARGRDRINLWALASSLPALQTANLSPDLVVATDPGHYASALLDAAPGRIARLAMPLSAARGAWRTGARILIFTQPNFFEYELVRRSGLPAPEIDAHGTVAGSALLLARRCGAEEAVFCGLDFCCNDLRSHVTPHAWDALHESAATRLTPAHSSLWSLIRERAPEAVTSDSCRTSPSLRIYASSFREICRRIRAVRLYPSAVEVPGMGLVLPDEFRDQLRGTGSPPPLRPALGYPARAARRAIVDELMKEWIDCLETASGRRANGTDGRVNELLRFFGGRFPPEESVELSRGVIDFLDRLRARSVTEAARV